MALRRACTTPVKGETLRRRAVIATWRICGGSHSRHVISPPAFC
jgi:hypothetical protein